MRIIPGKLISIRTDSHGGLDPMATFYLDGDRVIAEWSNENYREEIEAVGIRAPTSDSDVRYLRPSDGREFFEALAEVYHRRSLIIVSDVTKPLP